ncbi:minor tail protein [Mycobacterium phage DS6A]|uniref:Uncharacterized protein n=1 Tax=Mycobacterium phage DS6A TaxID=45764 RepID=G8I4D9_9CAUD|nr:minor tail protein [Mycobacterium phage DS6A]AER47583.1 hypothetical protein DS6A_29 [Mycobacterium phage DS6A]
MYDVKTDHQVVPVGADLMQLVDCRTGALIATATRTGERWMVAADGGIAGGTVGARGEAITALVELALAALGGTGYSTLVPSGLSEVP